MPVTSKEIGIVFLTEEDIGERWSKITPRFITHPVGNVEPHMQMFPEAITGCSFGQIESENISPRIILRKKSYQIYPPLNHGESFWYSVRFGASFDPKGGAFRWGIKHPTRNLSFAFLSKGKKEMPNSWRATLITTNSSGEEILQDSVPVRIADGSAIVNLENPSLGQILEIQWSKEAFGHQ